VPKANKYVIFDIYSKKYYRRYNYENECSVAINNASEYTEDEYIKYNRIDYLHPSEKFIKINGDGEMKIM
jgi:hypothetical protein